MLFPSDEWINVMTGTFLKDSIVALEDKGLRRHMRRLSGQQGREVIFDGRKVLNFCSNNYLGLANDPRLQEAAIKAVQQSGIGTGASRLVCGNMDAHQQLEGTIARFKGVEACLMFSAGYMANIGVIASLFGREDIVFSDKLNHASIVDGIRLSRAEYRRYPHCNMEALEAMLKNSSEYKKRVIITDSVFSMDGDVAPLDQIVSLAKRYSCWVMVDEAHAVGVMGANGRGAAEYFGVEDEIDIHMGTLSKAAGSFGAYCCGSKKLVDFLINHARSFIYTTGLPPSIAAASARAIEIIESDLILRKQLWTNARYLRDGLRRIGFDTMCSETPIIPILIKDVVKTVEFSKKLFEVGVLVSAIRPPTVPVNTSRLRLTVMAAHTRNDLDCVLNQCQNIGRDLCLL